MKKITNLDKLIHSMNPVLHDDIYVFASLSKDKLAQLDVNPIMEFQEEEGVTVIVTQNEAEKNKLNFECPSHMITLNVHSSLDAVGFLAAITAELASVGISVNAVSAFYHDHLFVPKAKAKEAMGVLMGLAKK